ncbi:hypothetical+protein [Methylocapsa aurea]|jgi:hypothetical protein
MAPVILREGERQKAVAPFFHARSRIEREWTNPMQQKPDGDDYLALFGRYKEDFGDVYMDPEDERFRLLFDQICRMLTQPSSFNLSLPAQFRATATHYLEGDPHTVAHMKTIENRHFMLSDLFDYIHLVKTMGGSWDQRGR